MIAVLQIAFRAVQRDDVGIADRLGRGGAPGFFDLAADFGHAAARFGPDHQAFHPKAFDIDSKLRFCRLGQENRVGRRAGQHVRAHARD